MRTSPEIRPLWTDRRFQEGPPRPWRKIHLDFHNSQHMTRVGDGFDPEEFGDRLQQAHVDAIVVFAKDMHGYFYYPSAYGPVHQGLSFDLLGQQVSACRARGIKVYAYYCVTWDNYLAEHHPEWLVFKRDRTSYLPAFDQAPGWTALCLAHDDLVRLVLDHSRELVTRYPLDGVWYDMPLPINGECYCAACLAALRAAGDDPLDLSAQRRHKQQVLTRFLQLSHDQARVLRPGCTIDQNNQTRLGLAERAPFMSNIDIESLPTAGWGYLYFSTNVRYARTFGVPVCGQTGRFHRSWADFGGLKHPNQLRYELARVISQGAQCCIGDQPPPSGRLDRAVYATIGGAYAEIARLQPFLERATPVTEAAIVIGGLPLDDVGWGSGQDMPTTLGDSVLGMVKLLMELHIQFDVIDSVADLTRYRLLVLPDALPVSAEQGRLFRDYLAAGGAILASHQAALVVGTDTFWADDLGVTYRDESPFTPAYLVPGTGLGDDLPALEYALYEGSARWQVQPGAEDGILAFLGEPLFQRGAQYTSHAQTPFDHLTGDATVVHRGRLAATAFPIASSYYRHGYWIYRKIFERLVRSLLPVPAVRTSAPVSTEITVTHQQADQGHPERWMVHVVSFSPNLRAPGHVEYAEDPIPLRDVQIDVALDVSLARAYLAAGGAALALEPHDQGYRVMVPRVDVSSIVVLDKAPS